MILNLLIGAAALCAATGVFLFIQYVRYRMNGNEHKEQFYMNLHYIALALLFAMGIVIMFYYGAQPD